MKNAELPAMPCEWKDFDSQRIQVVRESYSGLTKREMFAIHAMQGLCTHSGDYHLPEHLARDAVMYADAVLAELEKSNE